MVSVWEESEPLGSGFLSSDQGMTTDVSLVTSPWLQLG